MSLGSKSSSLSSHYNREEMARAFEKVGLKRGDVVFSHSNVGYFGYPEEGRTGEAVFQTILGAFEDVLGDEGTLVVPTFTYSFSKGEPYDPEHTPSTCGVFTEMLRKHPEAHRTRDPIFSVAALGGRARELTADVSVECFGLDSFWDRFFKADGVICNLNFDAFSSFIHYVERRLGVPYRYDKLFTGEFVLQGRVTKGAAIFFCQDITNPDTVSAFEPFDEMARQQCVVRTSRLGKGAIAGITAADTYRVVEEGLKSNPWLLTEAAKTGISPTLSRPANTVRFGVSMPEDASMDQMIQSLWALPRDLVSDGYDAALEALAQQVPMTVHEYPTGTSCWTWIVPERWTCQEAYVETIDGRRIFSYADNPLHVASYSQPFEGEVSREELFEHLAVHRDLRDAVPFRYLYHQRNWQLCCSQKTKDALNDDAYRVVIRADFCYGTLKGGEVVVPGESEECITFCAHLDHPAQADDGLSGVAVGIEVMRALWDRKDLRYTYRMLIIPETIGSIAYLSHHEDLIPLMKGGVFLEMLGLDCPPALQLSHQGDTDFDRCCVAALKDFDPDGWTGDFLQIVTNDERQFNAPGVRVPMVSLSRVVQPCGGNDPCFPEYHTHLDSPELVSSKRLEESRDLVLHIVDCWEANRVPVTKFKGEVFLSRHGISFDFSSDPEASRALFDVMFALDGDRSILDIAEKCDIPFGQARTIVERFYESGLIEYRG